VLATPATVAKDAKPPRHVTIVLRRALLIVVSLKLVVAVVDHSPLGGVNT